MPLVAVAAAGAVGFAIVVLFVAITTDNIVAVLHEGDLLLLHYARPGSSKAREVFLDHRDAVKYYAAASVSALGYCAAYAVVPGCGVAMREVNSEFRNNSDISRTTAGAPDVPVVVGASVTFQWQCWRRCRCRS